MSDMGEIFGTPPAGDDNPEGFVSNDQSEDRAGTAAGAPPDTGPAPDTEPVADDVDEESLDTGDTETGPQA